MKETQDLVDALAWQIELGADEAVGDVPVNRFERQAPVPPAPSTNTDARGSSDAGAAAIAKAANSLSDLEIALRAFEGCALKKGAQNTVFADGNPEADLMIVGEAPGRDEDRQGKPFVGRSGQLLDRMLAAIGRARHNPPEFGVYITNVLPWRPPQNRDPSSDEIVMLKAFLDRHIELAAPKILITMGNAATKTLLETETGITRLRGTWSEWRGIPVMPTFHPAALLRNPIQKREVWKDLLAVQLHLMEVTRE